MTYLSKNRRTPTNTKNYTAFVGYTIIVLGGLIFFATVKIGSLVIPSSRVLGSSIVLIHGRNDDFSDNPDEVAENTTKDDNTIKPTVLTPPAGTMIIPGISTKPVDEQLENTTGESINNDGVNQTEETEEISIENKNNTLMLKKANGMTTDSTELNHINDLLESHNITIEPESKNALTINNGSVKAQTTFPVIVNPFTQGISVATTQGEQQVLILPEQAVMKAKTQQSITLAKKVALTELGIQPVYEIAGSVEKKLLGIFPVKLEKTAFISAENGVLIKTDQTPGENIIENLSF